LILSDKEEILKRIEKCNHSCFRFTRDNYTFQYFLKGDGGLVEVAGKSVRSLVYNGFLKLVYLKDHNKNQYVLRGEQNV